MNPVTGSPAPSIIVINSQSEISTLPVLENRRQLLLLFIPKKLTRTAVELMLSLRDNMKICNSLNTDIAVISSESVETLDRIKKEHNLNFPLFSDTCSEAMQQYGIENGKSDKREKAAEIISCIVDKEGKIKSQPTVEEKDRSAVVKKLVQQLAV